MCVFLEDLPKNSHSEVLKGTSKLHSLEDSFTEDTLFPKRAK